MLYISDFYNQIIVKLVHLTLDSGTLWRNKQRFLSSESPLAESHDFFSVASDSKKQPDLDSHLTVFTFLLCYS